MPATSIDDCSIDYEVVGSGAPIVITGGGRESMAESRSLAEKLSTRYRVILWDRTTTGASDLQFDGPRDLDLWATQLATLLYRLDAAPAYLVASSAGARTSLVTALRYPDAVKGMLLYLISGQAPGAIEHLSKGYRDTAAAAEQGGMAAVMKLDYWAEQIRANPANRGRLLAMDPQEVARTLRRWAAGFDPTTPMMGLTASDLERIKTPTRVMEATEPTTKLRRYNRELAQWLPNAELIEDAQFQADWTSICEQHGIGSGHYTEIASLPRVTDEFISMREAISRRA